MRICFKGGAFDGVVVDKSTREAELLIQRGRAIAEDEDTWKATIAARRPAPTPERPVPSIPPPPPQPKPQPRPAAGSPPPPPPPAPKPAAASPPPPSTSRRALAGKKE